MYKTYFARSGIFLKTKKILKINGSILDKQQLEIHLQKIASSHNLLNKTQKNTYPIPHMLENFKVIQQVYNLLNEHLKLGIGIHPAGEWLLDNLINNFLNLFFQSRQKIESVELGHHKVQENER